MNNSSDATRLYDSKDSTVLSDNTVLSNDESSNQTETTTSSESQPSTNVKKAPKKSSSIGGSHFAAAGAGVAVGAGSMAAINAMGGESETKSNLNNLSDDKDNTPDEDSSTNDSASADDNTSNSHLFDSFSSKDISTDDTTEIDIDPTSGQSTIASNGTVNVNVNINTSNPTAGTTEAPLHVTGPNPAEAVHQAGINMHQNAMSAKDPEIDTNYHHAQAVEVEAVDIESGSITAATGVNDSMSFSQAFATARAEVGPGGSFTWHGQVYGTYYENEWNAMSPNEQHQFQIAAVQGHTPSTSVDEQLYAAKTDQPYDLDDNNYVDSYDDEVHVINMSEVTDTNGDSYNYAQIDVNGTTAVVVDTDHDMIYDVMHVDIDGNQNISPDELYDISEAGLSTDDVAQQMMIQESQDQAFDIDSQTDFDNNMDMSSFEA